MINSELMQKKINRNLNCCSAICHKFRKIKILCQHPVILKLKMNLIFINLGLNDAIIVR